MRFIWIALVMALAAGCGSGGGSATPGALDSEPAPTPTSAALEIRTLSASTAVVIYGVEFVLYLPAGVTVAADPTTGAVPPEVLRLGNSGAFAGARYRPATADTRASVTVLIADAGGFTVGDLATLTCSFAPGMAVTPAGFSLEQFVAKNANGAEMTGIAPQFSVRTQ